MEHNQSKLNKIEESDINKQDEKQMKQIMLTLA